MIMRIFEEAIDEIHSFDASYRNVILSNNNLLIPYINLGISNHPLNTSDEMYFIDFSYMFFLEVSFLNVYLFERAMNIINLRKPHHVRNYFGGEYLDYETHVYNGLEIYSSKAFLYLPSEAKLSKEMWAIGSLNANPSNLNSKIINDFFSLKNVPPEIKRHFQFAFD